MHTDHCHHHHRRGGFGRDFGPDFGFGPRGPFGPGRHGGPGGRRRRGDVRLGLLLVLDEEGAKNGYQLIQALSDRSEGEWNPSPGSVYPTLSQLEDEGLISATQREGESGRYFELTQAGREHLAERGDQKPPWEQEAGEEGNPVFKARHEIRAVVNAAVQVLQERDPDKSAKAMAILSQARKDLYRILAEDDE